MTTETPELRLRHLPRYDAEDIAGAETLHVGQYADLKREEYVEHGGKVYLVRWWLNRGRYDHIYPVAVEARRCPDGTWFDVGFFGDWYWYNEARK